MIKPRKKIQILVIIFFALNLFRLAENRTACCTDEGNKETNFSGLVPEYRVSLLRGSLFFGSKRVFATELMTPYLQAVTKNSVYVMVEADNQSPITVQYGETTSYGMTSQTTSFGDVRNHDQGPITSHIHKIKLTGLEPNTQYHYKTSQSVDYTFWTAPNEGTPFRFAWMSDIQGGNPLVTGQIVNLVKNFDPRFSLYGGDLADYSYVFKRDFFIPEQLSLIAKVPFFLTWGNHDVSRAMNDNILNLADVSLILGKYTAISVPVNDTNKLFDVNADNIINLSDVSLVLSNYTALETRGDN